MREGWDTCRTSHGLSRALQRLLPHGAECVYEPEREGEREYVCVVVAEGGDPTPPPEDCASLTGWRGRWGHCNKANTHTHMHPFLYGCYVLASLALSRLHTSIFPRLALNLLPSQTCSHSSFLVLPLNLSARLLHSPPPTFHLPPLPTLLPLSLPLSLYGNINMLPLIWRGEGHMLFLAGGPQPAKLLGCVFVCCVSVCCVLSVFSLIILQC